MRPLFAIALALLLAADTPRPTQAPARLAEEPASVVAPCTMDSFHPLRVELALDQPLQPGQWLRAHLVVSSSVDLQSVDVALRPDAGLELQGERHLGLGALAAGAQIEHSLSVRVPDRAQPLQLFAMVTGSTAQGPLQRGRVLHLLPRGPQHPAVARAGKAVDSKVLEYPGAARRVGQ